MPSKCKCFKPNGKRCQAYSMHKSSFCFWHSPEMKDKRVMAQKKGGHNRRKKSDDNIIEYDIKTYNDIQRLVAKAINDLLKGESTARKSRAIGYLCNIATSIQREAKHERYLNNTDYMTI